MGWGVQMIQQAVKRRTRDLGDEIRNIFEDLSMIFFACYLHFWETNNFFLLRVDLNSYNFYTF